MKKLVYILTLISLNGFGQYSNSWINFNQDYFKIPIYEQGVYEITYGDLASLGVNLETLDPRNFQIFHRGEEVSIIVEGESDAKFDPGDYIRFYANKNDGTLDTPLYLEGSQPHTYYNLFNDTTSYFLTWKLNTQQGKRMANYAEINVDNLPIEANIKKTKLILNNSRYAPGRNQSNYARLTRFDYSEGWSGNLIQEGNFIDYVFTNVNIAGSIPIELTVQILGESDVTHVYDVLAGPNISSLTNIGSGQFDYFIHDTKTFSIDPSAVSASGELTVRVNALGINGLNDLLSTSFLRLDYPGSFDFQNADSEVVLYPNTTGKSYIELVNPPGDFQIWNISDENNPVIIQKSVGQGDNAVIRNTLNESTLYVFGTVDKPALEYVSFRRIEPKNHNYIIITNDILRTPVEGTQDPVMDFANYRASPLGGSYDTLIVNINQLYNQFSFGETSPLAIYKFIEFMQQGSPEFIFIIGKGTDVRNNYFRQSGAVNYPNLVPTAGFPASDLAYSAGLNDQNFTPLIPVGRISAITPQEVVNYLDKVKEMESVPFNDLWRKKILQLSGGITANEQETFRRYTDGFANKAVDIYLGGTNSTINKNTTETVSFINISDEINRGLNLVTFFGHSNPNITDIDIGFVTDPLNGYDNKGKYPAFIINGCEAGQVYDNNRIFGEDWILAKDKGAISFIAHSSYGLSSYLRSYTDAFYHNAYGKQGAINKTIGEVQIETIKDYVLRFPNFNNLWHPAQIQQMILLGDPAVKLFGAGKPDYHLLENQLKIQSFSNEIITASSDSFNLAAVIRNYGIALPDSFSIKIERFVKDKFIESYNFRRSGVLNTDTLNFTIKNEQLFDFEGLNRFVITLDDEFLLDELNELNNVGEISLNMPSSSTLNIWPFDFSIHDLDKIKLVFQSTDAKGEISQFEVEIDTTALFNSEVLKSFSATGNYFSEVPVNLSELSLEDTTTFYWRSRLINNSEVNTWNESSFTYMKGASPGWNQGHYYQFLKNGYKNINIDSTSRRFSFNKDSISLQIITYGEQNEVLPTNVSVKLNGLEYITNNLKPCRDNTINLIAFSRFTSAPYAPAPFIFQDARTCGRQPQIINSYTSSQRESGSGDLIESIDKISNGDTVVLFTIGDVSITEWSANFWTKLAEIGVEQSQLADLASGDPFIIVGKKGAEIGSARIIKSLTTPSNEGVVELDDIFYGIGVGGEFNTPEIGFSNNWDNLSFSFLGEAGDYYSFDIQDSEGLAILSNITQETNIADKIPLSENKIVLRALVSDSLQQSPAIPRRITINYQPYPEGLLLPSNYSGTILEIPEGGQFSPEFYFFNVSDYAYKDSLVVNYTMTNQSTGSSFESSIRVLAPLPGDSVKFNFQINSLGFKGMNNLQVSVNEALQTDQFNENNVLFFENWLNVIPDTFNPTLLVKVDDRVIIDGELVSANPKIEVSLVDENKLLNLNDTSLLNVFIKHPCETCVFEKITYSTKNTSWTFDEEFNKLSLISQLRLEDGIYTLRAEAVDVSGNKVADEPFLLTFEVISELSISNFYPYPNPFSDKTRFVFTLTGSEIPDDISIRIMTISGRVVREIRSIEFGPIHIGNNISEFEWDGTDKYGDKLANGVYLYRVQAKRGGELVKLRETAGDRGFKNGLGKIYIAR